MIAYGFFFCQQPTWVLGVLQWLGPSCTCATVPLETAATGIHNPPMAAPADQTPLEILNIGTARAHYAAAYDAAQGPGARLEAGNNALVDYLNRCAILMTSAADIDVLRARESKVQPGSIELFRQPLKSFITACGKVGDFPQLAKGLAELVAMPGTATAVVKDTRSHKSEATETRIGYVWANSVRRREAADLVFMPPPISAAASSNFNSYTGPGIARGVGDASGHAVGVFLEHVTERICKGNRGLAEWVLNWCAGLIQRPGEKVLTSLVMRGERGSGKGLLVQTLRKIVGSSYVRQPAGKDSILGRFNSSIDGCLLLFMDELSWAGNHEEGEVLKRLTTEEFLDIERKYQEAAPVRNLCHILIASNNDWVVPCGELERRFTIVDTSDELSKNKKLGQEVHAQLSEGINDIAEYLYQFNYRPKLANVIFATDALADQQAFSFTGVKGYWLNCLASRALIGAPEPARYSLFGDEPMRVKTSTLHAAYSEAMKVNRNHTVKDSQLVKELKTLCPSMKKVSFGAQGKQGDGYEFPMHETAIDEFRAQTGFMGAVGDFAAAAAPTPTLAEEPSAGEAAAVEDSAVDSDGAQADKELDDWLDELCDEAEIKLEAAAAVPVSQLVPANTRVHSEPLATVPPAGRTKKAKAARQPAQVIARLTAEEFDALVL